MPAGYVLGAHRVLMRYDELNRSARLTFTFALVKLARVAVQSFLKINNIKTMITPQWFSNGPLSVRICNPQFPMKGLKNNGELLNEHPVTRLPRLPQLAGFARSGGSLRRLVQIIRPAAHGPAYPEIRSDIHALA